MTAFLNVDSMIQLIQEQEVKFLTFRFTDINGAWHQVTQIVKDNIAENLNEIITIDASSIKGWKGIENSDIILKPDYSTFFIDPFCIQVTAVLICDLIDTETQRGYDNDPRNIAKLAEEYLKQSGIADKAFFGLEPEFFLFDDVKYSTSKSQSFFNISASEMEACLSKQTTSTNLGHGINLKEGYHAISPNDHSFDLRSEILTIMKDAGLNPALHHHEVGQNQCEVGFKFDTLIKSADNTQKTKFIVKNVASSFGKSATFMPKPLWGENGNGMHVHQSLWKDGENLFFGDKYDNLSDLALNYIAGILHFAKTISAFSNPTTNSYKRLVPGYEAPIKLCYSAKNRSASIRIPYSESQDAKRIEVRFPDPSSNPYLMLSAMLMAGIYGIENNLIPEDPKDENLFKTLDQSIQNMPSSLEDALNHLEENHDFLLKGGVFSYEFIQDYIKLKREEIKQLSQAPHPIEFKMYYSS